MKCLHCAVGIHEKLFEQYLFSYGENTWTAFHQICPECSRAIIFLDRAIATQRGSKTVEHLLAYPAGVSLWTVPSQVPDPYKQDFDEACAVLPMSAKASAP